MCNSFQLYLNDISKYEILSKEEEILLIYKAQNGNQKAFDLLVLSNLRFVISTAKKYLNQGLELSDLVSVGNIGLIESIKRFDPQTGNKLITYSVWWIKQKILEAINNETRLIRLPSNRIAEIQDMIRCFKNQTIDTSYLQTLAEVCSSNNISEFELINMMNIYLMTDPNFRDKILNSPDRLISEDFLEERLKLDTKSIIQGKIGQLKDREMYIAQNYFDLFGNSKTLESIGEELDLTRERVRQIKVQIIKNLGRLIKKSDFNDTINIPYSLVKIKEDSYPELISVLLELSDFVNVDYHIVDNLDTNEVEIEKEYDLNDDVLMELYESL